MTKDITPKAMRCVGGGCPSIHKLDDGRLLIVGSKIDETTPLGDIGEDEDAVIISPDLLADVEREWQPTHRHVKGDKEYRVEGQALHTETNELLVLYSTQSGVLYARPKEIFEDGRFVALSLNEREQG